MTSRKREWPWMVLLGINAALSVANLVTTGWFAVAIALFAIGVFLESVGRYRRMH